MVQELINQEKVFIPLVPEGEIRALARRIKPVVEFQGKILHYIKPVDIFADAYTWEPKAAKKATGLVPLCEIKTYHAFGNRKFFKPSVAEVLAQIPARLHREVVAFEIIASPEMPEDFGWDEKAFEAGYHVATTRLYSDS